MSLAISSPASAQMAAGQQASPGAAMLGQCVIGKTTGYDRVLVGQWLGTGLATAPQLEGLVTVDEAGRDAVNQKMAQLFVRLFTVDCVEEARPLIAANDIQSVQMAFAMLGEVAMGELMSDPRAMAAMSGYVEHIPADAFEIFTAK
jgi:hypothetical protein